jgi:hypothetical protein
MKEKNTRRTPEAVAFHEQVAQLKPRLDTEYGVITRIFFPHIDLKRLSYAVAGRTVYWEALPALRVAAGEDAPPVKAKLNIKHREAVAA